MLIKGLAHICLCSTDLAASEKFYCQGLGFKKVFDFIRNGQIVGFYLKIADGTFIEIFKEKAVNTAVTCPIRHLCLEVAEIDQTNQHLIALGYEVTEKQMGGDNSWQSWTTDPTGVKIEFHQYTENSSQITGENVVFS
ncbi:VOC family protein [candidate division KSB1 bacterium]|nr:VOC family protein [candidate division KSB1 bacterium]